jgi:hypothetical protein
MSCPACGARESAGIILIGRWADFIDRNGGIDEAPAQKSQKSGGQFADLAYFSHSDESASFVSTVRVI